MAIVRVRMVPARFLLTCAGALMLLTLAGCSTPAEPLEGTQFRPPRPATPFQLRSQFGSVVSLSDHKGSVVLLTFLYTQCPDICPVVTSQLRDAYRLLGNSAEEVAFVAISVDPDRDTVEQAYAFSKKWDMLDRWDFLVGGEEELRPIWESYFVDPSIRELAASSSGPDAESVTAGHDSSDLDVFSAFNVDHAAPVYLIDRESMIRVLFTPPIDPEEIVHDIRQLLR